MFWWILCLDKTFMLTSVHRMTKFVLLSGSVEGIISKKQKTKKFSLRRMIPVVSAIGVARV